METSSIHKICFEQQVKHQKTVGLFWQMSFFAFLSAIILFVCTHFNYIPSWLAWTIWGFISLGAVLYLIYYRIMVIISQEDKDKFMRGKRLKMRGENQYDRSEILYYDIQIGILDPESETYEQEFDYLKKQIELLKEKIEARKNELKYLILGYKNS